MKKGLLLILVFVLVISGLFYLNQNFTNEEKTILTNGMELPFYQQLELITTLYDYNQVRNSLLDKYRTTGNSEYYKSYLDSGYTLDNFYNLTKKRKLTRTEFNILTVTLKVNTAFYSDHTSLQNDSQIGAFSNETPYPTQNIFISSKFTSKLPFAYYKGKGWQLYPVTATFWASEYFKQGNNQNGIAILDELSPYMSVEEYNGMNYGVFKVYFEYSNSSIPWVSSYSQGMATGLYAKAYNQTKDKKYFDQANLLFNSFKVPQNQGGFVTTTKFGTWFLEYNFLPKHLILNGHIITMQGIYDYYQVTKDPIALKLFNDGTASVKNSLPEMDSGDWSYYALTGKDVKPAWKASKYYMGLHVELLNWLHSTTKDPIFEKYAKRWEEYLKNNSENVNTKIITMP